MSLLASAGKNPAGGWWSFLVIGRWRLVEIATVWAGAEGPASVAWMALDLGAVRGATCCHKVRRAEREDFV